MMDWIQGIQPSKTVSYVFTGCPNNLGISEQKRPNKKGENSTFDYVAGSKFKISPFNWVKIKKKSPFLLGQNPKFTPLFIGSNSTFPPFLLSQN